jgi:hypothetical protein
MIHVLFVTNNELDEDIQIPLDKAPDIIKKGEILYRYDDYDYIHKMYVYVNISPIYEVIE